MPDLTPVRGDAVALPDLVDAFNGAFEGYLVPMSHTVSSLHAMISTNDVRLEHSFLLRDRHGAWAGVALLGVRGAAGWVAGMAVAPAWRRRGVGDRLMRLLLAEARHIGLRQIQLEVLDENAPAIHLYTRLGFRTLRPLTVYMGPLRWPSGRPHTSARDESGVTSLPVAEALADFAAFHQVAPPWQRDLPSLRQSAHHLAGICLRADEAPRAYMLYASSIQGPSVLDFGSRAPTLRARADDALRLLAVVTQSTPGTMVRVINVPPGDAIGDALDRLRCPAINRQREMTLTLPSPHVGE